MTPAMLAKLRRNVERANADNVEVIEGDAESIPLPDGRREEGLVSQLAA